MRREQAEQLIGKMVVTSFMHGGARYIGELTEVIPSKPFRSNIKVYAIAEYPSLYAHNSIGKFEEYKIPLGNSIVSKKGEIINAGNGIEIYGETLPAYKESLIKSLQKYISSVKQTLDEFIKAEGNYYTCYIDNLQDSQRLYDILLKRLEDAYSLDDD